jgi:PAS domain S-box-containing protein
MQAIVPGMDDVASDPAATGSAARMVRRIMLVGVLLSVAYALLFWVLLAADASARLAASALSMLAALAFAGMALKPTLFSFSTSVVVGVAVTALATAAVAVATGRSVSAIELGLVPLVIGAAAQFISVRATVSMALAQALVLILTAVVSWPGLGMQGLPGPVAYPLLAQLWLVVAATAIGLATRGVIDRSLARMRSREQRFAGLLGVAADWYWETDAQLRFTHVSEQVAGGSGLAADQRLGKRPWEIDGFGADDDEMDAHRADLEAHRPFTDLLLRRVGRDGRARWLSASGRPRFDERGKFIGYWGVGRDISAEHEAELARGATELRYRELFARSPSPLVLHRGGRVLDANGAALALFGAGGADALVGRPLLDFYDASDGSRELAARRAARLDALPSGEATPPQRFGVRTLAGRLMTVQVTSVKVDAEDGPAIMSIYRDETEQIRADLARERSEALLAHVVATSPAVITLADRSTGRCMMVNDTFTALLGYSREEAIGRTAQEAGLWPDIEARERYLAALDEHGVVRDMDVEFRHRDGHSVLMRVSAARFTMEGREYIVLNGRDVTQSERERLEREAILANASIGIALTRERRFQLANPKFEQMFGWPPGTLAGQPGDVTSVDAADYEALGLQYGPALARGEAVELERMMRRRDGSTFLCRLLARPIDPRHPATGATIWIAEDVTEQRAVQQALARARDEALAASRAKSAFLANTSHEIRTPLNGLVGLARLARQPGLDEERRAQYLVQIDDSAQALSGVISDILDLSRIEASKQRLESAEFDLGALLESIEQGYAALAEARSLVLTIRVDAAVPRRVHGDALRVRQILSNFLSNALKFTESGTVRLNVSRAQNRRIRFEVEDTGPGIAAEVQQRLFEPFMQADNSTTRRYGGTGLGLAICRRLAHLMGGEVGLVSAPGQGSRFWAELPLALRDDEVVKSTPADLPGQGSPLAGRSVLLVEDNPVNRMIAVALLQQWGVDVSEASHGLEAVAAVRARADAGRPFDLVLMDVQMPVQGGHDATRELRQRFSATELPIVALTAAALTSERELALDAGMNDFLTKPIDAQHMHDTVLRWIRAGANGA